MTMDIIKSVCEEFIKRLQLPEAKYSFSLAENSETLELIINVENTVSYSLSIGNGTIRVVYSDDYDSDKYVALTFLTPITLLYQLCVFFFSAVKDVSNLSFNDLLSIVLLFEIRDWKELVQALAENVGLSFEQIDNYVKVNNVPIHYNGFESKVRIDTTEIKLDNSLYSTVVEAMFKCVEYVANLMDVADNIFNAEEIEEDNVMEEETGDDDDDGGSNMDIDMDVDIGGGAVEAVSPVEVEDNTDFSEPTEATVTMDDVLE